jgi:hypothetical protein
MKIKFNDESLLAILLKGLALVCMMAAAFFFLRGMSQPVPDYAQSGSIEQMDLNAEALNTAGIRNAFSYTMATSALISGIVLWWMGSVIALLDKLVKKDSVARAEVGTSERGTKVPRRKEEDEAAVPRYSL